MHEFSFFGLLSWYHGKLDRHMCEERLRAAGRAGSFLVRESAIKPDSLVLSFLSNKLTVYHFKCDPHLPYLTIT